MLAFLHRTKVRIKNSGRSELELKIRYQTACAEGGPGADLFAAACEYDPLPKLSEEILQEGRIARGKRKSPEQAKLLSALIRLRGVAQDAIREARAKLRDAGLPDDAIAND